MLFLFSFQLPSSCSFNRKAFEFTDDDSTASCILLFRFLKMVRTSGIAFCYRSHTHIRSHGCSSRPCTRCVINCCATSLIVFISSFQIMSNLGFLERTLGSLKSWPQDILRYLFLVKPTPYTTLELAAFFFGNRIPLITALDFFHECCNPPSEILDFFHSIYDSWERRSDQEHVYEYYDMRIGEVVELSGFDYHDYRYRERHPHIDRVRHLLSHPYHAPYRCYARFGQITCVCVCARARSTFHNLSLFNK